MAGDPSSPEDLLIRYLDLADQAGFQLSVDDFVHLMEKLGIKKTSSEHFFLVWNELARKGKSCDPQALDKLKSDRPEWAAKIDKMVHFESVLNSAFSSTQNRLNLVIADLGLVIEEKLKIGRAIETYLVSRRPGSTVLTPFPDLGQFIIKVGFGPVAMKLLKREYQVGRHLDPSLFVRPVTMGAKEDITWISLDYASGGSLERSPRTGLLDTWLSWQQLARALANMHEKLLCHNDVKASNILVTSSPSGKICRIGDLQLVTREGRPVQRFRDKWDHPDWESGQAARRRDDVYRLAMTIAWMIDPRILSLEYASNETRISLVEKFPAPFAEPLKLCLNDDPMERIESGTELHRVLKGSNAFLYLGNPSSNNGE